MELALALATAMAGYVVGMAGGVLVHEAAHALTARYIGCGPRVVTIGRGPVLARLKMGKAWLVIHALPIMGFAGRLPLPRSRRGAIACIVAAGPLASLALLIAAAVGTYFEFEALSLYGMEAVLGIGVAQAMLVVGSLMPRRFKIGRDPRLFSTDGYKLLQYARGTDQDEFAVLHEIVLRPVLAPGEPLPQPSPGTAEMLYQLTRRDLATDPWAGTDATAVLTALIDQGRLSATEVRAIRRLQGVATASPA